MKIDTFSVKTVKLTVVHCQLKKLLGFSQTSSTHTQNETDFYVLPFHFFFSSLNPFWFNFSKKSSISSIFYLTVIFDYPIHSLVPWVSDNGAFTVNGYSSYYIIKYRQIIRSILLISLGMGGGSQINYRWKMIKWNDDILLLSARLLW